VSRSPVIDLTLDRPVVNRQNPFRIGVLGYRFRRKPNHVLVSTALLDVRDHMLILTVMMLVRWHGGQALYGTRKFTTGCRNPPEPFFPDGIRRVDTPNGSHLEYAPRGVSQK